MRLLARLFQPKPPPPQSVDDLLQEVDEAFIKQLAQMGQLGATQSWSKEEINAHLESLEKIEELRERRKYKKSIGFFQTPAGASILTGIITISATQMPAMLQLYAARQEQDAKRMAPLVDHIAKDNKLSIDEKLAVIKFISYPEAYRPKDYGGGTVEEFLKVYRSRHPSKISVNPVDRASAQIVNGSKKQPPNIKIHRAGP